MPSKPLSVSLQTSKKAFEPKSGYMIVDAQLISGWTDALCDLENECTTNPQFTPCTCRQPILNGCNKKEEAVTSVVDICCQYSQRCGIFEFGCKVKMDGKSAFENQKRFVAMI